MIGIAPRINGYAGTFGDTLPVNGVYTQRQKDLLNYMRETLRLTKAMLKPGMSGREIDVPGREYYEKHNLEKYIVCPFAHSIGLMEAEAPFFGPGGDFKLKPGMTVMVDISFFGHPELYGGRIETGYVITEDGCRPMSPRMDAYFMKDCKTIRGKTTMELGKRTWVFADGDLPPQGDVEPLGPRGADGGQQRRRRREDHADDIVRGTGGPKGGIHLTVPAKRVKCFRMDYPVGEEQFQIPFGQYAVILESNVPVVCLYGRLDRRPDMAYYPIAGFSA